MKKSFLVIATYMFVATTVFTGCNSSADKLEKAQKEAIDANLELEKANTEYLDDVENYRLVTNNRIEENNKAVAEFNARIVNEKKQAKADYQAKILVLEQKNTDLKKRLDDYKADGKDNWATFKADFNKEMDELVNSVKELTSKK
jgi:light-regulated signal transduction histidine kinase (bacteriophytochrome)